MKRRVRLQTDATDFRIQLLQPPRRSDECAARPQPSNKVCNAAGCLLPDFAGGGAVMRLPVCRISVLVGVKIVRRIAANKFVPPCNPPPAHFTSRGGFQL